MRFLRRYRAQIVLRVLLIAASCTALAYLVLSTSLYEFWAALLAVVVLQVAALIRFSEQTAREVARFLEAIRYSDFSVGFPPAGRGELFDGLSESFAEVTASFRRVRAEREAHNQYLEHVVQRVRVALICFETDGRVRFINPAAKRLLQLGRLKAVQDLNDISPQLAHKMTDGGEGDQELVKIERDGRHLQLSVARSRFRLGEDVLTLASLQDIGGALDEKEMEAWQTLTRVLTHEIMNSVAPIASLASTAGTLLEEQARASSSHGALDDVREAVDVIERRSEGLMHFVDAYRSFTRIPAPRFELIPAMQLLLGVRRLLNSQLQAKGIECRISCIPEDLVLTADPNLMEQVLINLLLNAIEAVSSVPHPVIELRARVERRGLPVVDVVDNGTGIPPDVQEQIFVPFFTTRENGSGIGLSLSRQILRLHGGTIRLESEPGKGSTFTIAF